MNTEKLQKLVQDVKGAIATFFDNLARMFIKVGLRHFKGAAVDVRFGDDLYVLKKYWPKHDIKTAADKTKKQKPPVTKLNTPEFWAAKAEEYNTPGFADFMVLDCFEKKLP